MKHSEYLIVEVQSLICVAQIYSTFPEIHDHVSV